MEGRTRTESGADGVMSPSGGAIGARVGRMGGHGCERNWRCGSAWLHVYIDDQMTVETWLNLFC